MLKFRKYEGTEWSDEPSKVSALAASWTLRFRMFDAPVQRFSVGVAVQPLTGVHLMGCLSSGHEIEIRDDETLTLMMPHHGRVEVRHGDIIRNAVRGDCVAIWPSTRTTKCIPPADSPFEAHVLKIPVLHPLLRGVLGNASDTDDPFVRVNINVVRPLSELVRYILTDFGSATPVLATLQMGSQMDSLVEEYIRRLFEAEAPSLSGVRNEDVARLVRTADEYMRMHFHEAVRVADIAKAVGVGVRGLQAAFKKVTGRTPVDHLTAIRLESARVRLLARSEKDSVSGVAWDCGFTHLGRFAALYRSTYHEAPSQTLRQVDS